MDEVEYKLNTKNSVLIVNAIDKLISTIKSKYKPVERQKFVIENEELKFLREKCSSKEMLVSLTACQGLLALVEMGVLEIPHTMSTIVTLLPTAHNYSAIITTMAGLLILDLKSRLVPGQSYKCQFSMKSPKHPFITVLEKNNGAENEVLTQMHALCTHPDYNVSSNSLELLRPVFLWLTCNPERRSIRPWQLLLSLPQSSAQFCLLLSCLSCQQISNPQSVEVAFAAYAAVTDAAIYRQDHEYVTALLPMLARISNELIAHGCDPRPAYALMGRCAALPGPQPARALTLALLARSLPHASALHLHGLITLVFNMIAERDFTKIALNMCVGLSLQWLHLPSYLTTSALKTAVNILDIYQSDSKEDSRMYIPNLKQNKIFQHLLYSDERLFVFYALMENWERMKDDPDKMKCWMKRIETIDVAMKEEITPFLIGIMMEKRVDDWFAEIIVRALEIILEVIDAKKEISVMLIPVLMYKIANDSSPIVRMECLKALPLMAKTKENVPNIINFLNKLKTNKGVPMSFLIMLYTRLAETQIRCFPYLQELLVECAPARSEETKAEVNLARAMSVQRICEIRAESHGVGLVPVISATLNSGGAAAAPALLALRALWTARRVAPPASWAALRGRPAARLSICKLLAEVPGLRLPTPSYDEFISETARLLWSFISDSHQPAVVEAACDALANYKIDDYKLKDIPEVYRRTVKLPASYCKTPVDAARRPEDVLDYVPCEVWPEVFKYTNQAALEGVERLAAKLIEREVRGFRSGVYQAPAGELQDLNNLPPHSVLRGLIDCFRKQVTSPSYEFPESGLVAMLRGLGAEFPRPLPPVQLLFLHEVLLRGASWRRAALTLAARQAPNTGSARRLLENFLVEIDPETSSELDVELVFELLPILCRGMPPNSLRTPLERCLYHAFQAIAQTKMADASSQNKMADATSQNKMADVTDEEPQFIRHLAAIKSCLDCDKIHDANRTLLSQMMEHYFGVIPDDNISWPAYVSVCVSLPSVYLERMTSPSSWWEVTGDTLRKATSVRAALAAAAVCEAPLVWLNEIIDTQATYLPEQESSLAVMFPALKAAGGLETTPDWFLQLMARTQAAFKETEDMSAKLYLCDVFALSVAAFSGLWALGDVARRSERLRLLPAAAAALLRRDNWRRVAPQTLEWLRHTEGLGQREVSRACRLAAVALRHQDAKRGPWMHWDGLMELEESED